MLWYPSNAGYQQEYEAIANELTQNLDIKPITFNASPFTPFLADLADKKVTNGIYRGHWGAYYPSMQNTLENLFELGAPVTPRRTSPLPSSPSSSTRATVPPACCSPSLTTAKQKS